jgi:DHA2 family multidrug resistance protein-like MFS transporter
VTAVVVTTDARGPDASAPAIGDRWALVAVAGALSFIAMLDMSIVNVALADIGRGLGISASTALWVVLGYQLSVVALLLPAGRWLDGAGLRAALLSSIAGFTIFSVSAALSPWTAWLISSRIAQGAFGAVLFVLMPVLAVRAVRPELRGRAMSVPATLGPLGAVAGPVIGGVLVDHFSWHAVFLVKVPFCVAAFVVAWRCAPRGGSLPVPDRRSVGDAGLIGGAVVLVLLAFTFAGLSPAWLLLIAGAVLPLAIWSRRGGGRPVWVVLARSRTWGPNGAVLMIALAFAAMSYLVALHLQVSEGVSAATTGLTLLTFALAMGLAGPLGGRLADTWGARRVAVVGAALVACGLSLLLTVDEPWEPTAIAWRLAIAGLGMGLYGGPTQMLVMISAPKELMATAGSTVQLARSMGFTFGPPLAAAAWTLGGSDAGVTAGLGIAAGAACLAVALLALPEPARAASHADLD